MTTLPDDIQEFVNQQAQDAAEQAEKGFLFRFQHYAEECGSPIERLFLAAILDQNWYPTKAPYDGEPRCNMGHVAAECHGSVFFQVQILSYRVDFLFAPHFGTPFIVECDGHDFHERTKKQAERDRCRDRRLLMAGFPTLRFTGSEIYRDPLACRDQVEEFCERGEDKEFNRATG